ncbi:MAG: T9SS type A sorting domain-containing protein [Bacteroidota bacterium]
MKAFLSGLALFGCISVLGQYAPPADQEGTTALPGDTALFIDWASNCTVVRGYMNISTPDSGYASVGEPSFATGPVGDGVVSLGDAGVAVLQFSKPICNGPGFDFAVFENSFSNDYLELAFVEVSSNGVDFFRFPSASLTPTDFQTSGFGYTDARMINNLAGKYRATFGTPFDLAELAGTSGLNIYRITHVKIVDVVGCLDPKYATYDADGRMVNDPWPTPFPSSGFDLDAVGVIHNTSNTGIEEHSAAAARLNGNPVAASSTLSVAAPDQPIALTVYDLAGKSLLNWNDAHSSNVSLVRVADLPAGSYVISWTGNTTRGKVIIVR